MQCPYLPKSIPAKQGTQKLASHSLPAMRLQQHKATVMLGISEWIVSSIVGQKPVILLCVHMLPVQHSTASKFTTTCAAHAMQQSVQQTVGRLGGKAGRRPNNQVTPLVVFSRHADLGVPTEGGCREQLPPS